MLQTSRAKTYSGTIGGASAPPFEPWPLFAFDMPVRPIAITHPTAEEGRKKEGVVQPLLGREEHAKARFRMLRRLRHNHDGEGAAAADRDSVDEAIAFLSQFRLAYAPLATLDDDGRAVIEIEHRETGFFADITFIGGGSVECYRRSTDAPSETYLGRLDDKQTIGFFEKIGVR